MAQAPRDHASHARAEDAPASKRSRTPLWIAAAALLGFIAGFALQFARVREARRDADFANQAVQAARLEAELGAAVIEAQSARYEVARQRASDFYTGLQRRLLPIIAPTEQDSARVMLSERDSIITALARNDPSSPGALASVLVRLRETISRAGLDSSVAMSPP